MLKFIKSTYCRAAIVSAACLLASTTAVFSQEEATALEPSKLVLTMADGTESVEYSVNDVSFFTSELAGVDGAAPTTDLSLSIGTITPLDQNLLQWAANTGDASPLKVVVTAPTGFEGDISEIIYELTSARVTSLSLSHSTYGPASISLQVAAEQVSINGTELE